MSIRLSLEEVELRDALAHHLGIDHAGVMRMALLKLARSEDITVPERKMAVPEGTARRKRWCLILRRWSASQRTPILRMMTACGAIGITTLFALKITTDS